MEKKKINKIIQIVVILIIILAFAFLVKTITSHAIKGTPDKDWLSDNCECIERENRKCPEGFEIPKGEGICKRVILDCPSEIVLDVEDICEEKIEYTNPLLTCSKYDCSGKIYRVK